MLLRFQQVIIIASVKKTLSDTPFFGNTDSWTLVNVQADVWVLRFHVCLWAVEISVSPLYYFVY